MSVITALCINCGEEKKEPQDRCKKCGFVPASDIDKAKSILLSIYCEIDGVYCGPPMDDFEKIKERIRRGEYEFDESLVQKVVLVANSAVGISTRELAFSWIKWIAWPVTIAIVMFFLIFGSRH